MNKSVRKLLSLLAVSLALGALAVACGDGDKEIVEVVKEVVVEKEVVREVEVPGETVVVEKEVIREVEVPGETVVVEKIREVEIPGETVVVEKEIIKEVEVPGETVVVEKEIIKEVEVPGETIVVEKIVEVEKQVPTYKLAEDQKYGGTLRVTSEARLATLDVGFSGASATAKIAYHIWERLIERDQGLVPQSQMTDGWDISADQLTYTFVLRPGLKFHDGTVVKAGDVTASFKRMWPAQPGGSFLNDYLAEDGFNVIDDLTFAITFTRPLGVVIDQLASVFPLSNVWPERIANTPASEDHGEEGAIGSGPYKLEVWERGNKVVVERFEDYLTRTEPGSHLAGGKKAYLDRIEWIDVPAIETKIAGLKTGEWDVIDSVTMDFYEELSADSNIGIATVPGMYTPLDINVISIPASYKGLRQAIQAAIDIEELMYALGPDDLWTLCPARYRCGYALENHTGEEFYNQKDLALARQLLDNSGYQGETFLLLNGQDLGPVAPEGPIWKKTMEDIGITVEMPGIDWASAMGYLGQKDGNPDDWDGLSSWWGLDVVPDPVADLMLSPGVFTNYGLSDMFEGARALRDQYAFATTLEERTRIIGEIQLLMYEDVPQVMGGQWANSYPYRTWVKNLRVGYFPFYGNVWLDKG